MVAINNEIERIKNAKITAQKARLIYQMLTRNKKAELLSIYSESSIYTYNQIAKVILKIQEEDDILAKKIWSGNLPFTQDTAMLMKKKQKEMGGGYADTYRYIMGLPIKTQTKIKQRPEFNVLEGKTNILMLNIKMWNNQVTDYLNEVKYDQLSTEKKIEFRSAVCTLQKNLRKIRRRINE